MAVSEVPETRYAKTRDGVHVAYEVFGEGPFDLVFANSWCSHAEFSWSNPTIARFYERLSSFCRLVLFDKRGTGSSDPIVGVPTMEDRTDDIRAVMDAAGIEKAALFGGSEGAATCAVFAATYPERTSALVMFSPFIVGVADDECPWAWSWEVWDLVKETMAETWGTPYGSGVEFVTPSLTGNQTAMEWYGHYFRAACSPAMAVALLNINTEIDIRPVWNYQSHVGLAPHRRPGQRQLRSHAAAKISGRDSWSWKAPTTILGSKMPRQCWVRSRSS